MKKEIYVLGFLFFSPLGSYIFLPGLSEITENTDSLAS